VGSFYRSEHELVFVFKVGTAPHVNTVELGRNGRYRAIHKRDGWTAWRSFVLGIRARSV
jgi:hypothetical protein